MSMPRKATEIPSLYPADFGQDSCPLVENPGLPKEDKLQEPLINFFRSSSTILITTNEQPIHQSTNESEDIKYLDSSRHFKIEGHDSCILVEIQKSNINRTKKYADHSYYKLN